MQLTKTSTLLTAIVITASALFTCPQTAFANGEQSSIESRIVNLETRVGLLEREMVEYGPIAVTDIHLSNAKHYATVQAGETIECSFHYKLDSSQQEFLTKNHLIVGLEGVAAEACATHLYGVWDSSGKANFKLLAPLEVGTYQVRIAYFPGKTCEDALKTWNVLGFEPGSYATIGILNVVDTAVSQ